MGLPTLVDYLFYQMALRSGYLRWQTPVRLRSGATPSHIPGDDLSQFQFSPAFDLPGQNQLADAIGDHASACLAEADEIVAGNIRLFGGPPVPINLVEPGQLNHWTSYVGNPFYGTKQDIKWVWEPGRFGWAYSLGRAYILSGNEIYSHAFWRFADSFLAANPSNLGPHWASAQEVALRLIAIAFALHVFANSPHSTADRLQQVYQAIVDHATRIPLTLRYARAQNNNHLLSEAVGLFTAGTILPKHPQAAYWRRLGRHWLNHGLQSQIQPDGTYIQQSTNYHRLMLQLALWANLLSKKGIGEDLPEVEQELLSRSTLQRMKAATRWLQSLVDMNTGQVPNLGPNDGAYILPLTSLSFSDYRPVLQAAASTFLGRKIFPSGPWDEMALWLVANHRKAQIIISERDDRSALLTPASNPRSPHILRGVNSWAYLRAATFNNRPGHADQLHLDLWWRGFNLAQDAGTYLYNGSHPWDNSLAWSEVHNTVTVDGLDQMTRAGRFLWLDWAQGKLIAYGQGDEGTIHQLVAQHEGYRHLGVIHRREVTTKENDQWVIRDWLIPSNTFINSHTPTRLIESIPTEKEKIHNFRLHWLLPDWPWEYEENPDNNRGTLGIESPFGWIRLSVMTNSKSTNAKSLSKAKIVRAGNMLIGSGIFSPVLGWVSPTYGYKVAALSFSIEITAPLPVMFTTIWELF